MRGGLAAVACAAALAGAAATGWADDFDGKQVGAALKRTDIRPAPRLADGHPDLGNSKGSWEPPGIGDMAGSGGGFAGSAQPDRKVDVSFLPWAKDAFASRNANFTKDDPEGYCLPPGIPRMYATSFPFQIYQLPDRILFVFEGGAHMWRVVYVDGRKHTPPDRLNPTYLGEGIGHWDGDTLVVDVTGLNDRSWIDAAGHPHTEKLHVVERFTRVDYNTIVYEATSEDPKVLTKPFTIHSKIMLRPGTRIQEYVCEENNQDPNHFEQLLKEGLVNRK